MSLTATALLSLCLVACRFGFAELLPATKRGNADGHDGAGEPDASVIAHPEAGPELPDGSAGHDAAVASEDGGDTIVGDGGLPFYSGDAAQQYVDGGDPTPTDLPVDFAPAGSTPRYGGDGGSAFSESCPQGYAITGYRGFESASPSLTHILRIQALCSRVTVVQGASPGVTMSDLTALAEHGTDGDIPWQRTCPAQQVVVGFAGRHDPINFVNQLVFYCAPLTAVASVGGYALSVGAASALPVIGTSQGGSAFGPASCPAGQVVTGDAGQSGFWLDALELSCAVPSVP
jgi:hypothetical protein